MSLLRCGPPLGSVFTCFHCFFWGCWAANQNPWCVSWHSAGYVQCLPCFWERDLAGSSCGLQMWWCPCWARLKLNLGSRIFFFAFYNCTTMVFIFRFHASLVFVYRLPDLVQHFFTESVRQHAHWSFQASSCFRGNMSWCFLSKTDLEHQARLVLCNFYLPITTALSWSIFVLKSVAIRDVHNSIIVLYGLEMIFIFIIADDLSHFL